MSFWKILTPKQGILVEIFSKHSLILGCILGVIIISEAFDLLPKEIRVSCHNIMQANIVHFEGVRFICSPHFVIIGPSEARADLMAR